MRKKLLFLTLNTFSATGGIEKVCRVAAKALHEIASEAKTRAIVFSMYDKSSDVDGRYLSSSAFKGFKGNRIQFVLGSVKEGRKADVVILSHINLLMVGYLVKLFSPKTKLVLIAHGIEVWSKLNWRKRKMLQAVDQFLPVSRFTAQKLQTEQRIAPDKIEVLNNCLDPFLEKKSETRKERDLKIKYGIKKGDFVLLTLTRLKYSEQYKGYDKVVKAMASLKDSHPEIKYLIVGRYEAEEKARLDKIIKAQGLLDKVVYAGFIPEEDLSAHFSLADVYIMPSTGEGFGVVFIEALFYGKPVIAGNKDGSVDALGGGELGILVNPCEEVEIISAIEKLYNNKSGHVPNHQTIIQKFGFASYRESWRQLLLGEKAKKMNNKNRLIKN